MAWNEYVNDDETIKIRTNVATGKLTFEDLESEDGELTTTITDNEEIEEIEALFSNGGFRNGKIMAKILNFIGGLI